MVGEELAHRPQYGRFGGTSSQFGNVDASQGDKTMRPIIIAANPGECPEQHDRCVGISRFAVGISQHGGCRPNLFVSRMSLAYEAPVGKGLRARADRCREQEII